MSKITQALEKAARERLLRERHGETLVVTAPTPTPAAEPQAVRAAVNSSVDPHIVTFFRQHGPIAEQYRMLRTNLQSLRGSHGVRSLLVTSALRGEGKTVTALNLALTLAQQPHCRVLLIDADLRKRAVNRWLGLGSRRGLSDALKNGFNASDALVRLEPTTLTILPAGRETHELTSERLDSQKMTGLLQQFKREFDYVLLDSPPMLLVADSGVLSRHVDGVLLVVRAGKTQRKDVLAAREQLSQVKARVVGTVLTHVEYYNPYYARYYRDYEQERVKPDEPTVPVAVS